MIFFPRGGVVFFDLPGVSDKPSLIVSRNATNVGLGELTLARITSVERERFFPTSVMIAAGEVSYLPLSSFVLCHDLHTVSKDQAHLPGGAGSIETVSSRLLRDVDVALRYALAIDD